ncbi:MAG: histidinol dehydrogenase, partial [Actinobacteria bacterium]|nr:histidinol dehydrogenase [Actinomycetota bacterium]
MLRRIDLRGFTGDLSDVLPRPETPTGGPVDVVRDILAAVAERGDAAVREYTSRFDGVELDSLVVADAELEAAMERIEPDVRAALELAADRIAAYHEAQMPADVRVEQPGVSIRGMHRAVERAACYVPGGRAVYPSTVLMTAVPARVAGVEQIVVCVPPGPDGKVPDIVLAAAKIAGAHEVLSVGGAQAIGAVAHGTESIRPVDVIVGPGNIYVALAKQEVAGTVGVPSSFAGPSEVVVVADGTDPADFAAVDVILQAEHGPDGLAWFVTWNAAFADEVTTSAMLTSYSPDVVLIDAREVYPAVTPLATSLRELSRLGVVVVGGNSREQRLAALRFGADDVVASDTASDEIALRCTNVASRVVCGEADVDTSSVVESTRNFGPVVVDISRREIHVNGHLVPST